MDPKSPKMPSRRHLKKNIKKVFTVPGNKKLKIKKRNEKTFVRIPKFKAHVALVIEY